MRHEHERKACERQGCQLEKKVRVNVISVHEDVVGYRPGIGERECKADV